MASDFGSNETIYALDDVKNEFRRFKNTVIKDGSMQDCANYVPIRLVTIIEQFFRAMMIEGKIRRRDSVDSWVSVSTLVDIFEYHKKPQLNDDGSIYDYAGEIAVFCDRDNRCDYDDRKNSVILQNVGAIEDLVSSILGPENADVSKWIEAYTQSFQSVRAIEKYAKDFFDKKEIREDYSALFDTRHNLVHTLSGRSFNASHYLDLVDKLFKKVEEVKLKR